jgi:hypothetical protein
MAGTSHRKRVLLPLTFLVLLGKFGRSWEVTYRSGANLWQCRFPACQRVEQFSENHRPQCSGPPDNQHPPTNARKVRASENLRVTDKRHLFK